MRWLPTLASLLLPGVASLRFDASTHTYEDLLVTISPDIVTSSVDDQMRIIAGIKAWVREGSATLFQSSRGWASFNTVKILLPLSWTNINDTISVDGVVFEDGDIRVDQTSGLYGDSPFTVQTGGCGEPGEYIQISAPMLEMSNFNEVYGPPGQVFVHEWAKYRYGIFEEHGYPGDEKYPMFFMKKIWTAAGEENVISPNFCLNTGVGYAMENIDGGMCQFDEETGLPDANCIFVLTTAVGLTSSIMALPYHDGNHHFCDDTESLFHDATLPNRHNMLCNQQSTFSVIRQSPDFSGFTNGTNFSMFSPTFELLLPQPSSSFVMVLDVSGSMAGERLDRTKQSAWRWVNYDLKNEVPLGIVTFNEVAERVFPLTPVSDENRKAIKEAIDGMKAGGGTGIGNALLEGVATLNGGGVSTGGVIILMTDGEHNSGPSIGDVIDKVVEQGVRVIAMAFGKLADADIILLAERTNGKAYFIPDGTGPEDINNAFEGSLTYQPSVPSDQVDIVLTEKTFSSASDFSLPFFIDNTVGREVIVQIDFKGNKNSQVTIGNTTESWTNDTVYQRKFDFLDVGNYSVKVLSTPAVEFASIQVSSKAQAGNLPIFTRCWTSAGTEQADLATGTKVAVMAQVLQGSNPVIRAKVRAYIESENQAAPMEVNLFDQGAAPDNVKDDGIYSRYFTTFDATQNDEVRYTVKCQVEGTDTSAVNQGFLDARRRTRATSSHGRSLPRRPSPGAPICCGSSTVTDNSVLEPTGEFGRSQPGGLLSIVNAAKANYPPGSVTDLVASDLDLAAQTFLVKFTAPGDVLDSGMVKEYGIYFSRNLSSLAGAITFDNFGKIDETFLAAGNMTPVEAGTPVVLTVRTEPFTNSTGPAQYFFRLEAKAKGELTSASNTARIFLGKYNWTSQESGLTGGAIAGIVFGTMLTVLVTVGAGFWYQLRLKAGKR